jgi:hypothetical protein
VAADSKRLTAMTINLVSARKERRFICFFLIHLLLW